VAVGDVSVLNKAFKGILILWAVSTAIAFIVRLTGEPSASNDAQNTRETEEFATKMLGEKAIRSVLKDPDSAVFTETDGRVKGSLHVACGYVNAKNSFGALAGASPWLVIVESKTSMIASGENAGKFNPLWNKYCVGPQDGNQPKRNPPDSFRGIKWGSALPSALKLRETALKGCAAIIEQKDFTSIAPCSHMHIDTDDMELFTQRQNVPPIFDVPVSEQVLDWSYRKFWSAQVFIHNYREADLTKLRAALIDHYGPPTFNNEQLRLTKWSWAVTKLEVSLSFDPVAKPSIGSNKAPQTSISVSFGKIE
jgi:hypothetical protein